MGFPEEVFSGVSQNKQESAGVRKGRSYVPGKGDSGLTVYAHQRCGLRRGVTLFSNSHKVPQR